MESAAMKLCRVGQPGQEKPAVVDEAGQVRSLAGLAADIDEAFFADLDSLRGQKLDALPIISGSPRYGSCVSPRGKVVCVGLNYRDHAAESNMAAPTEPVIFIKGCRATGPDDAVPVPPGATKLDWEVELGIVIGKRAYGVSPKAALDHVAGYCIVDDVSERAFQLERGGQWTKGKSAEGFAPVGPWLVTRDEIPDPQSLGLRLEVNGTVRQNGTTADMIFGVVELVSYISRFMVLYPGDVISTGTPAGVGSGQKPTPIFLTDGDVVELTIDRLGRQRHQFVRRN
jgi:2-keto-4-pentenoate hydratase/2-oxohepta-3-ene-1,7-dioic acid hydratase in catechol pathway